MCANARRLLQAFLRSPIYTLRNTWRPTYNFPPTPARALIFNVKLPRNFRRFNIERDNTCRFSYLDGKLAAGRARSAISSQSRRRDEFRQEFREAAHSVATSLRYPKGDQKFAIDRGPGGVNSSRPLPPPPPRPSVKRRRFNSRGENSTRASLFVRLLDFE